MKLKGTATILEKLQSAPYSVNPLMHIREKQSSGTIADISGSRFVIKLNDIVINEISGAILDSNVGNVTLPSGEYYFQGFITGWKTNKHRAEIRNEFAKLDQTFLVGPIQRADNSLDEGNIAFVKGYYQFTATQIITLYHNVETYTGGHAYNGETFTVSGVDEVYSNLLIWKLS